MPDIDLEPDEFGERDPRTGRRRVKDDPRAQWFWLVVGLGALAAVYFNRSNVSDENVFWGALIPAVIVGMCLWPILSRLDR